MDELKAALAQLETNWANHLEALSELVRIPSISGRQTHRDDLLRCSEAVATILREAGLAGVELLHVENAPPFVVGHWLEAGPSAPTLLLYAHYDVQPTGKLERWHSPPFEPRQAADGRLYGRGAADDKAAIILIAASLRAWFEATACSGVKRLPVNLKVLIEGEEEIGSIHLAQLLETQRERLAADVVVLADTANLATGLPSLTTSLRGLVSVDVEVRTLDHPLHSGLWGGPLIDASSALVHVLARLMNPDGEIAVPDLQDDVPVLSDSERKAMASLPFEEAGFRKDAGAVAGLHLVRTSGSVYEQLWRKPSLAITALDGGALAGAANQLTSVASAQVQVRLAPGQDPERVTRVLRTFLESDPPFGAQITTRPGVASPGWHGTADGPFFEAARRALCAGYGQPAVSIGCGGSIPFVRAFSESLGGVPVLLIGVEDPLCNAHGENESLELEDLRKAARSFIQLFAELADSCTDPSGSLHSQTLFH